MGQIVQLEKLINRLYIVSLGYIKDNFAIAKNG